MISVSEISIPSRYFSAIPSSTSASRAIIRSRCSIACGPDLIGNIRISVGRSLGRIVPGDDLPPDQVHDPPEGFLLSEGNLDRQRQGVEALLHLPDRPGIVRPDPVHLVDERHLGDTVLVGLVPDGLRLGFHAAHGAEDDNGPVENPEASLDLNGEIDMPRRIDDVDLVVFPSCRWSPPR